MSDNKNTFSKKSSNIVQKNYKKKEESIEYRFSNNIAKNLKNTSVSLF